MDLAVERLESLRVADIMARRVITIPATATVADTARVFRRHEIAFAPVVDERGSCQGVIASRDLLRRLSGEGADPSANQEVVTSYMSTGVQSIAPEAPILLAARMMCAQHLHRLLVLDHAGRPVGVISSMDIVSAVLKSMDEMRLAHS